MKRSRTILSILVLIGLIVTVGACSSPSNVNSSVSATSGGTTGGITGGTTAGTSAGMASAIAISASPTSITTGGTTVITAHVVDSAGMAVQDGTVVRFSLDNGLKGTLSASQVATSGGNASVTLTGGSYSTTAVVTAAVGSGASANTPISIVGTTPAMITVIASPTAVQAGNTATVTATVTDSLGKIVSGATVSFSVNDPTKAAVSSQAALTDSTGKATVTVTAINAPNAIITATCLATSGAAAINITGSASVGTIVLSSSLSSIVTNGSTSLTVLLRNASNLPIANAVINFTLSDATAGSLSASSATTNANGVASLSFTAAALPKSVTVSASYAALALSSTVGLTITAPAAATGVVSVSTNTVTVRGTATITADLQDSTGAPVKDGTQVNFALSDSSFGALSNSYSTTFNGKATITFTAASKVGSPSISVVSGGFNGSVTVIISAAPTGSIQFVSATPTVLGIKGSGQNENGIILFMVTDITGTAVVDGTTVNFTLIGPNGGEYIGATPGSTTAMGATVGGKAQVILNSGSVAGPCTIIASTTLANGTVISTSTGQISIGGGVPSASHFNLATGKFNLPGLVISGASTNISAYLADRFGNYNVLKGTSISFYTEAGAIDRQGVTNEQGYASVTIRTQAPNPSMVQATASELASLNTLTTTYGISIDPSQYHPRNGWVTVLATVQGEEAFLDENGNGLFDSSYSTTACPNGYTCECHDSASGAYMGSVTSGLACPGGQKRSEPFQDMGEPFIDINDDGCRNDGATKNCSGTVTASNDPFELFVDTNGNRTYDPPNGKWDGPGCTTSGCQTSKMIWTTIKEAFTGNGTLCAISPTTFTIANGGSQSFQFMVGDSNANAIVGGSTIAITSALGGITFSVSNYTIPDMVPNGPATVSFTAADADPNTTAASAVPTSITVSVTSGTVNVCPPTTITGTYR